MLMSCADLHSVELWSLHGRLLDSTWFTLRRCLLRRSVIGSDNMFEFSAYYKPRLLANGKSTPVSQVAKLHEQTGRSCTKMLWYIAPVVTIV